jgi:hypothetical protein
MLGLRMQKTAWDYLILYSCNIFPKPSKNEDLLGYRHPIDKKVLEDVDPSPRLWMASRASAFPLMPRANGSMGNVPWKGKCGGVNEYKTSGGTSSTEMKNLKMEIPEITPNSGDGYSSLEPLLGRPRIVRGTPTNLRDIPDIVDQRKEVFDIFYLEQHVSQVSHTLFSGIASHLHHKKELQKGGDKLRETPRRADSPISPSRER